MIIDALHRIANHRHSLSREEARSVMAEVLAGKCSDAQIAALLVALHMKGETVEEIVGFAEAMRAAATPISLPPDQTLDVSGTGRDALVDTCGTGGDASGTFNISTATALVVAARLCFQRPPCHQRKGIHERNHERAKAPPRATPASLRRRSRTSFCPGARRRLDRTCARLAAPPGLLRRLGGVGGGATRRDSGMGKGDGRARNDYEQRLHRGIYIRQSRAARGPESNHALDGP